MRQKSKYKKIGTIITGSSGIILIPCLMKDILLIMDNVDEGKGDLYIILAGICFIVLIIGYKNSQSVKLKNTYKKEFRNLLVTKQIKDIFSSVVYIPERIPQRIRITNHRKSI